MRHLLYFDSLARHGHFGRAAEACAITQPALSLQIKELEELTGATLVERGGRQIRLTDLGAEFAVRVKDILRQVDDLEDLVRARLSPVLTRLRMGVIPTVAPYLLPRFIAELTALHPGLDLHIRETLTPRLLTEIDEGRLDAAIVALPVSQPGLEEVTLFTESFLLVREVSQADHPVPDREALGAMRLLLLEEGHCFRDQALSFCDMERRQPREWLDGSSLSTLVQMVGAGIGVTLIPEMAVPVETRSAPVAVTRFTDPQPQRSIGMVWRRSNPLSEGLTRVAAILQNAARGQQSQSTERIVMPLRPDVRMR